MKSYAGTRTSLIVLGIASMLSVMVMATKAQDRDDLDLSTFICAMIACFSSGATIAFGVSYPETLK